MFVLAYFLLLRIIGIILADETSDCRVYNNLYVCLEDSALQSVTFEDVHAVQTIEDIELHLEGLGITEISRNAFPDVRNASALYLRDNKLSVISGTFFHSLDQLTYLDLCNNSIRDIEDGAFARLVNLETLLLDYNEISKFRLGTWKGLSNLHELYMTNNTIALRKNMFKGLKHLETLALDANEITRIPLGTFNGLTHLDLLYLSRNRIFSLNVDIFRGLNEVNELDLGRNFIKTISNGVFRHLRTLDSLWLNGNRLTTLQAGAFEGLDSLCTLFLNSNDFSSVEMLAFAGMKNVTIEPGFKIGGSLVTNFKALHGRFRCTSPGYQEPYDWVFKGYRQDETLLPHPCYRSTSMDYGWYSPTIHTVPTTYFPRSTSFSTALNRAGMYRNCSLNTELDKSLF